MGYIDKTLMKAAKEGDRLCGESGVAVKAKYLGFKPVKNEKYNNISYEFKFKKADGSEKTIRTRQKAFLAKFATIEPGSTVEVTMIDLGDNKRSYEIDVLARPKMAQQSVEEEVVEEEETVEATEEEEEDEDEEEGVDPLQANF